VAIFNPADVGADKSSAALNVALAQIRRFSQFAQLLADWHARILSPHCFITHRAYDWQTL